MNITPDTVSHHAKAHTSRCWLLHGDDFTTLDRSHAAVRRHHADAELSVFDGTVDTPESFRLAYAQGGLFQKKRYFLLRFWQTTINKAWQNVLCDFVKQENTTHLLVVQTQKLSPAQQKSVWATQFETHGCIVMHWPIRPEQTIAWCRAYAAECGISYSDSALQQLAFFSSGNIAIAANEIRKQAGTVSGGNKQKEIAPCADMRRYNMFGCIDNVLLGNAQAAAVQIRSLFALHTAPVFALWTLEKEIKTVALLLARSAHIGFQAAWQKQKLWASRRTVYERACARLQSVQTCDRFLFRIGALDRAVKGLADTALLEEKITALFLHIARA